MESKLPRDPNPPRKIHVLLFCYVAFVCAVPALYYLGEGNDERFSWRMFSSERLQRCGVTAYGQTTGTITTKMWREIPLTPLIHVAWQGYLQRGNPRVTEAFGAWYCDVMQAESDGLRLQRSCRTVDGRDIDFEPALFTCNAASSVHMWIDNTKTFRP